MGQDQHVLSIDIPLPTMESASSKYWFLYALALCDLPSHVAYHCGYVQFALVLPLIFILHNTKSEKLLLHLAKVHLPEHKDNGNSSNTINISIGDIHSMYYVGIDLKNWLPEEVGKLKALILEVENRKQLPEHITVVDSHSIDKDASQQ